MTARALALAVCLSGFSGAACDVVPVLAGVKRAEGTFERTLSVDGPVNVDVSTGSGSIVVRAGTAARVVVEGRIRAHEGDLFRLSGISAEERVRRLRDNPPVEQTGNQIRIGRITDEDLRQNVSISYSIIVPADTSLVSRTGSGSQEIEGLGGGVTVSAGSGSIQVSDVGESVRAETGSGTIRAQHVGGDFQARAGSGSIEGTAVRGAIAVKTGSGQIHVSQSGAGDVVASAGSGSIELSGIRGGVQASTGSGSIHVRGEQTSDWRLSTSSGGVTVELTGKPAFDLDARGGRIDTTFPIAMSGQPNRRELRGTVNGGGPLLRVHTSSGHVSIR